jgi:hypothetical protein
MVEDASEGAGDRRLCRPAGKLLARHVLPRSISVSGRNLGLVGAWTRSPNQKKLTTHQIP